MWASGYKPSSIDSDSLCSSETVTYGTAKKNIQRTHYLCNQKVTKKKMRTVKGRVNVFKPSVEKGVIKRLLTVVEVKKQCLTSVVEDA